MLMSFFRRAGMLAVALVLLSSTAALAGGPFGGAIVARAPLTDLLPLAPNPTDGARAHALAVALPHDRTLVALVVHGLDRAAAGTTLGAHVHVGTCEAGNGAAAGPHYNSGGPADPSHEVWLDFTINRGGNGSALTVVPFTIPPGGAHAIVIHRDPTGPGGAAGPRMACLPIEF